jgi:S-adenosylmethionine:diacylglycerol 3-amino-3-carboxypropyl transferase
MKKPKTSATGAEPDWPAVRLRYEQREEHVAMIAESIGYGVRQLTDHAKASRWLMRTDKRRRAVVVEIPITPEPKPITSTKEAITRLKELVQSRIAKLEQSLAQGGENERGINAANLLARMETVEVELQGLRDDMRELRDIVVSARGGWQLLVLAIGIATSGGAVMDHYLPLIAGFKP